ncbi:hypothetical protein GGI15_002997 [Coemansia interrupta]|uniref:Arrestin-like N-terminal domain-containing protein n=1 Tax=Coemansia interrupta TaxID=1126814 RepID=A0A9W8LJW2_9FUNG|nr:hypothetical protein GGI15_002997 [Coemansia interrupta]
MAAPVVPYKNSNLPRIKGADERNNHFTIEGYWQCQMDPSNVRLKSVGGTASDISSRIPGSRNLQLHVGGSPLCLKLNMADVLRKAGRAEFTYTTDANETGPRLEIQISIDPNPVIVRGPRPKSAVVQGTVTVTSRQKQPAHPVHLALTGTRTQNRPTQTVGVTRPSTDEFLRLAQTLPCMTSPISQYSVGVYTRGFVFTLDDITSLPKTLDVPQCAIDYAVQATTGRKGVLGWPFGGAAQARARLAVVDAGECQGGDQACVVRSGVLGAYGDGDEARVPRFSVQMASGVAIAGQDVRLALDVQVAGDRSSSQESSRESSSRKSAGGRPAGILRRASMRSVGLLTLGSSRSRGSKASSSSSASSQGVPLVGAAAASSYVVRAKLVQNVRYVGDPHDAAHTLWAQRVVARADAQEPVEVDEQPGVRWTLHVPENAQPSVQAGHVQVQYDVVVAFHRRRGALRSLASRTHSKCVQCRLPLHVVPQGLGPDQR